MFQHRRTVAALLPLLAAGVVACGGPATTTAAGSGAAPAAAISTNIDPTLERPASLDTVGKVAFDGMASGLTDAAAKLGRGEDPTIACAKVLAYAESPTAKGIDAPAKKAIEQCGREIPLAWAASQLDKVAATGDVSRSITECATVLVSLDIVAKRFAGDPRTDQLRARSDELCR